MIAVEQQGHGHIADLDRPLTFEQMADDTAAALRHLGVARADLFGYDDGGNVALGLAIQLPALVRKVATAGRPVNNDGLDPAVLASFRWATRADLGDGMREGYARVAPRPLDWPRLVATVTRQVNELEGWTPDQPRDPTAPALILIGASDIVRPERALELARLIPHCQLAGLPDTDHLTLVTERAEWLLSMLIAFLEAPIFEAE